MAAIPIGIHYYLKERRSHPPAQVLQQAPSNRSVNQPVSQPKQQMSVGAALFQLALLGLASPIFNMFEGISGLIGLIILMVGIRIAWKIAEGKSETMVYGPFANSPPTR
jgi:predicted lipid-binding transport protein (Tim44 family)